MRRSISTYIAILAGGAVSWRAKKLSTVATPIMEAEYIALLQATKEILWIQRLLNELGRTAEKHQRYLRGQPRSNCIGKQPRAPRANEAHRCLISPRARFGRKRKSQVGILPHSRNGCGRAYKASRKGQALRNDGKDGIGKYAKR